MSKVSKYRAFFVMARAAGEAQERKISSLETQVATLEAALLENPVQDGWEVEHRLVEAVNEDGEVGSRGVALDDGGERVALRAQLLESRVHLLVAPDLGGVPREEALRESQPCRLELRKKSL